MKMFDHRTLVARALRANKKSKRNVQRRKKVEAIAREQNISLQMADIELWVEEGKARL